MRPKCVTPRRSQRRTGAVPAGSPPAAGRPRRRADTEHWLQDGRGPHDTTESAGMTRGGSRAQPPRWGQEREGPRETWRERAGRGRRRTPAPQRERPRATRGHVQVPGAAAPGTAPPASPRRPRARAPHRVVELGDGRHDGVVVLAPVHLRTASPQLIPPVRGAHGRPGASEQPLPRPRGSQSGCERRQRRRRRQRRFYAQRAAAGCGAPGRPPRAPLRSACGPGLARRPRPRPAPPPAGAPGQRAGHAHSGAGCAGSGCRRRSPASEASRRSHSPQVCQRPRRSCPRPPPASDSTPPPAPIVQRAPGPPSGVECPDPYGVLGSLCPFPCSARGPPRSHLRKGLGPSEAGKAWLGAVGWRGSLQGPLPPTPGWSTDAVSNMFLPSVPWTRG